MATKARNSAPPTSTLPSSNRNSLVSSGSYPHYHHHPQSNRHTSLSRVALGYPPASVSTSVALAYQSATTTSIPSRSVALVTNNSVAGVYSSEQTCTKPPAGGGGQHQHPHGGAPQRCMTVSATSTSTSSTNSLRGTTCNSATTLASCLSSQCAPPSTCVSSASSTQSTLTIDSRVCITTSSKALLACPSLVYPNVLKASMHLTPSRSRKHSLLSQPKFKYSVIDFSNVSSIQQQATSLMPLVQQPPPPAAPIVEATTANSHVPTTVGDVIMLVPKHHIAPSNPLVSPTPPNSAGAKMYAHPHSHHSRPSSGLLDVNGHYHHDATHQQLQHNQLCCPSPTAIVAALSAIPTPILDQEDTYVCSASSPRCFIIQKVKPVQLEASNNLGGNQTTGTALLAEPSSQQQAQHHHPHHHHPHHHAHNHHHHPHHLANGNGLPFYSPGGAAPHFKPPPLLGTAPKMPNGLYHHPGHPPPRDYPRQKMVVGGGYSNYGGSSIATIPVHSVVDTPTTNTNMVNGKDRRRDEKIESNDNEEGEEDATDDELYTAINQDRNQGNKTDQTSNNATVVRSLTTNNNCDNRFEIDEGIAEVDDDHNQHDDEDDEEEEDVESSTLSSNSTGPSVHSSPKRTRSHTNGLDDLKQSEINTSNTAVAIAKTQKVEDEAQEHPVVTIENIEQQELESNPEVIKISVEENITNNNNDDLHADVIVHDDDGHVRGSTSLDKANHNDHTTLFQTTIQPSKREEEKQLQEKQVITQTQKAVEENDTTGTVAAAAAVVVGVEDNNEEVDNKEKTVAESLNQGQSDCDLQNKNKAADNMEIDYYQQQQQLEQHFASMAMEQQQHQQQQNVIVMNGDEVVAPGGDGNNYELDENTPMMPCPANVQGLSMKELRAALKRQLEYYFSQQNLAKDAYLKSQMDKDHYVPIVIIANFEMIKRLTNDYHLVVDVLRSSSEVQVDEAGENVRPASFRNVVMLRDVPPEIGEEEIERLFQGDQCPVRLMKLEKVANTQSWYLYFNEDEDAHKAIFYLKEDLVNYPGTNQPILARMKAKPLVTASYRGPGANTPTAGGGGAGFLPQQTGGMRHVASSPVGSSISNNSTAVSPVSAMAMGGAPVIAGQPVLLPARNTYTSVAGGTGVMQSQLYTNAGSLLIDPLSGQPSPGGGNGVHVPYSAAGAPLYATAAPFPTNVPLIAANSRIYPPGAFYTSTPMLQMPSGGGAPPPPGSSPTSYDLSTVFVVNGLTPHTYSNVSGSVASGGGGSTTPTSTTPQPQPGHNSPTIQTPPSNMMATTDYCHPLMVTNPHTGQVTFISQATGAPMPLATTLNGRHYNLMSYPPGQPSPMAYAAPPPPQVSVAGMYQHPNSVKPHHERGGGGRRNDGGYRNNGGGGRRNHGVGGGNYHSGGPGGYYQGGQHSHNSSGGGNDKNHYNGGAGGSGYRDMRNNAGGGGGHHRLSYWETTNASGYSKNFNSQGNNEQHGGGNHGGPLIAQPPSTIPSNVASTALMVDPNEALANNAGHKIRDATTLTSASPVLSSSASNNATSSNVSSPMHNSKANDCNHDGGGGGGHGNNNNPRSNQTRARGNSEVNSNGSQGGGASSSSQSSSSASYRRPKHFPNYVPTKDGSGVMIMPDDSPNGSLLDSYPIKHKPERGGGNKAQMGGGGGLSHPRSNSAGSTATLGLGGGGGGNTLMPRSSGSFSQRSTNRGLNLSASLSSPETPEDPDFKLLATAFPPLPGTVDVSSKQTNDTAETKKITGESESKESEIIRPTELSITTTSAPTTEAGTAERCLSPQSLADVVKGNAHHHHNHNHIHYPTHHQQQIQQTSKTSQSNKNSSSNAEVVVQPKQAESSDVVATSQLPANNSSSSSLVVVAPTSQQQQQKQHNQSQASPMKRSSSAAATIAFNTTASACSPINNKPKAVVVTTPPTHTIANGGADLDDQKMLQANGGGNADNDLNDHYDDEHVNGGDPALESPDSLDNFALGGGGKLTYSQIAQKKEARQQSKLVALAAVAANATGVNQHNAAGVAAASSGDGGGGGGTVQSHHHPQSLNNVHHHSEQQQHYAPLNHHHAQSHPHSPNHIVPNSLGSSSAKQQPAKETPAGGGNASARPRSVVK